MLLKSGLLLATVLLSAAGIGRFWLLPGSAPPTRRNGAVALTGLVALLVLSVLDLRTALTNVIPSADLALLWRYATTTGHGSAVQIRLLLALALAGLTLLPDARRLGAAPAFFLGLLGLLSTFSVISHGAVMGGWQPLLSDLVHFAAAALWTGAVFVLVWTPWWTENRRTENRRAEVELALRRLSQLGLAAVVILTLSGVFNTLVHTGEPETFVASRYALALVVKLALVAVIVGLAAFNRFRFLPRLLSGAPLITMRRVLVVEALLLVLVLVATGWLTTTAVPHGSEPGALSVDVSENARRLIEHLRR